MEDIDIEAMGHEPQGRQSHWHDFAQRLAERDGLKEQCTNLYSKTSLKKELEKTNGLERIALLTGTQQLTPVDGDGMEDERFEVTVTEGAHIIPHFLGNEFITPSVSSKLLSDICFLRY